MAMFDKLKKAAEDVAGKHGDKIARGADRAGRTLDQKTGGKYTDKINRGIAQTKSGIARLDRKEPGPPTH